VLSAPSPCPSVRDNNNNNVLRPFVRTTLVSWYQKKHSPSRHLDHHPIFISFFHLQRSIASSLFKFHAWQSFCTFCTTSVHVLFGLPVGLEPPPRIPYISSSNQCLLFATHAHTMAACFAVVSVYHLFYNIDTTAKQVAMVWAYVAKRRHLLGQIPQYITWNIPTGKSRDA